jgi:hypothetical protein
MHTIHRSRERDDRGASALEFAFCLIPLMMVIAGIVNFGVVFAQQLSLDNATRAAARAGVVASGEDLDISARVEEEFAGALARGRAGAVGVTFPGTVANSCAESALGDVMIVRGEVTTQFLIPWLFPDSLLPNSVTLDSEAAFQCEYS